MPILKSNGVAAKVQEERESEDALQETSDKSDSSTEVQEKDTISEELLMGQRMKYKKCSTEWMIRNKLNDEGKLFTSRICQVRIYMSFDSVFSFCYFSFKH